jgi:hypothetical protein
MVTASSSETSEHIWQTTRHLTPEDNSLLIISQFLCYYEPELSSTNVAPAGHARRVV